MSKLFSPNKIAQRQQEVLDRLDGTGTSSSEQRKRGSLAVIGVAALAGFAVVANNEVGEVLTRIDNGIIENYDIHNLPPDGQPITVVVDGQAPSSGHGTVPEELQQP